MAILRPPCGHCTHFAFLRAGLLRPSLKPLIRIQGNAAVLQLHVQLRGQAVPNSPFTVSLRPGPVCLDRLQVEGASIPFMAGEEKTIDILTLDAYGHATAQDGVAKITVKVASGTHIISGNFGHN